MANSNSRVFFIAMLMMGTGFLFACKRPVKQPEQQTMIMGDTTDYTVISFDSTMQWVFDKPVVAAEISEQEIVEAERLLRSAVDEWNNSLDGTHAGLRIRPLQEYRRQFVAVTNAKGEKEVWVNCFCDKDNSNWQYDIVVVDDGGSCYFNVQLNLTTKTSFDLMVNGEA
jgi:hypothetical protein